MQLPFILARRFVAGETLTKALPIVAEQLGDGLHVTLDLLGEHVSDRKRASQLTEVYSALIRDLAHARGTHDANISIKLSMLGQVIDEDFCLGNLRRLLAVAKEHNTFVRLDMEGSGITQSTLDLFEAVYPDFPDHVGVVLQAYLHRTDKDIDRMCELNARVRLCKGAYGETAEVAYQDMPTIRARFEDYMQRLIEHARYPGIATHDDALIYATQRFVEDKGIGYDQFEFQMLYGLRPETQRHLASLGYNMRVYVPYGTEWLPYYSRRLRERRENVWFILSNLLRK